MAEERHKTFTKKRIALCAAVVLFAAVIGLLVANHDSTPMPVYQGKTVREWMYAVRGPKWGQADEALKQMGSNAVPFLVNELTRKNSVSQNLKEWIYPKLPQGIRRHLRPPWPADYRQNLAVECLGKVNSRTAVAPLLRVLAEGDENQQYFALLVLRNLAKPEDTNWIPQLTVCLKSSKPGPPLVAAEILERLNAGELAIPALTNLVTSGAWNVRYHSLKLLSRVDTTNSENWIHILTNDPNWQVH